ncbi:MAG: stealth family protein [Pseudoxanthomonas sp.]
MHQEQEHDIDAVITWVDGADPAHQQRLAAFLAAQGGKRPSTANPTRFNDTGEIDYCVASIFRFAPWFRRIHIVTDGQKPALLKKLEGTPYAGRVCIVDHREIFAGFEQHLPTFNSRSIISVLWRIPGLAENFVYFNDDMLLLMPVGAEDFFREGKIVLRGKWMPQSSYRLSRRVASWLKHRLGRKQEKVGNLDSQELSARLAGFEKRFYRLYHNPYPMRVSVLRDFFAARPELLASNVSYKLRSNDQFKAEAVATHLEIAQGGAILDNRLHVVQVKPATQTRSRMARKLSRADRDERAAFVCVQSLDRASASVQQEIIDWLDRRIGRLSQLLR